MKSNPPTTFAIIRNRGTVHSAETVDGYKVYRKERLVLKSMANDFPDGIPCAPYDNHFVYLDPSGKLGRWNPMCTCGSPAAVVGYDAYNKMASAQGSLIVCLEHMKTGRHADGSQ